MPNLSSLNISVVVATYNGESFVSETLRAILGQSVKPYEVIVVNDGSTDNTLAILECFVPDITVLNIENSGPEEAKKKAIEATSGEWIAICDHDDLWNVKHLERLSKLVKKYPSVTTVYSNFSEFGDAARYPDKFASMGPDYWGKRSVDEDGFQILEQEPFEMLLQGNPFFPSAGMFRRTIYDQIGGVRLQLSRNPSADLDMTSRMFLMGKVGCDWEITTHIRKYGGNYSGEILATLQGIIEVREFQLAEGGIYERHKNALNERIERIAIGMLQAAFSFQNRDAFNFASKRLNFWRLTSGLKLRVLIFKLPDALLRPIFSAVRFVKE